MAAACTSRFASFDGFFRREPRPIEAVREDLRALIGVLSGRYQHASAWAAIRRVGVASLDDSERAASRWFEREVVLSVTTPAGRFERATTELTSDGLHRAAFALQADAGSGEPGPPLEQARSDHEATLERDPRSSTPSAWLEDLEALSVRARRFGSSRILYRGAYLAFVDSDLLFISPSIDRLQRVVRSRAGVLMLAKLERAPVFEEAALGASAGLEVLAIPDAALQRAASDALALAAPQAVQTGATDVILAPSLVAAFTHRCIGVPCEASRWLAPGNRAAALLGQRIAAPSISVRDDPTSGGFGSYFFDDEGWPAQSTPIIEAGNLAQPLTDEATAAALTMQRSGNGRRAGAAHAVAPRISNLILDPGESDLEGLIAGVESGFLLQGARGARCDDMSWRFGLQAAQAREIRHGRLSGRLYGNVGFRGVVPEFLQSVTGVGRELERFASRCEHQAGDVAISVTAPALHGRGEVIG